MRAFLFVWIFLSLLLVSCSPPPDSKLDFVGKEQDQPLQAGYYSVDMDSGNASSVDHIPLVSIKIEKFQVTSHAFHWSDCQGNKQASFEPAGGSIGENIKSVAGPSYEYENPKCSMRSQIFADSNDTLRVEMELDGVVQKPILLKKVSKDIFIRNLSLMYKTYAFKMDEKDCQASFNGPCSPVTVAGGGH